METISDLEEAEDAFYNKTVSSMSYQSLQDEEDAADHAMESLPMESMRMESLPMESLPMESLAMQDADRVYVY